MISDRSYYFNKDIDLSIQQETIKNEQDSTLQQFPYINAQSNLPTQLMFQDESFHKQNRDYQANIIHYLILQLFKGAKGSIDDDKRFIEINQVQENNIYSTEQSEENDDNETNNFINIKNDDQSQMFQQKSLICIQNEQKNEVKQQNAGEEGFEDAQQFQAQFESEIDEVSKQQTEMEFSIPNVESRNFKKQIDQLPLPPIMDQQYSLIPDMIAGWRPKFGSEALPPPIPLCFEDENLDYIIERLISYKPKTSYDFHRQFSGKANGYNFKYGNILLNNDVLSQFNIQIETESLKDYNNITNQDEHIKKRSFIGMNPQCQKNELMFDSLFEGGNLACAIKTSDQEYDLFMRVDTNTKGHLQWYFFKLTNTKKGDRVKFNIQNFTKKRSLYQRGLRPFVKSQKSFEQKSIDWHQAGSNVTYQQRKFLKYDYKTGRKNFFVLSFEYQFEHDEDVVYFAQIPPYTYSNLINIIKPLSYKQLDENGKNQWLQESTLCKSLSGIPVQLLTITDFNDQTIQLNQRKVFIVISRLHPGETTGSWMCQGLIENLLSENNEIQQFRKKVIFKIIPMMNPDGVIIGNYRTGLAGQDLNRQFGDGNTNSLLFPSVMALRMLIKNLKETHGNNMIGFIDLHGHSIKKNIFSFGPYYHPSDFRYYRSRFIPKLLEKKSEYFRYYSCTYSQNANKQTARVSFQNKYNLEICYTIESTFGLFHKPDNKITESMKCQDWINFGNQLPLALKEYIEMMETYNIIKESRIQKQNQERLTKEVSSKKLDQQSPSKTNTILKIKSQNTLKDFYDNGDFIPFDESQFFNLGGLLKEIQKDEKLKESQKSNAEIENSSDNYSENQVDSESSDEDISTEQRNKLFSNITNYKKNFTKFVMGQKKKENLIIEGGEDKRDKIITHKLKRAALSVDRESKKKKGKKKKKEKKSLQYDEDEIIVDDTMIVNEDKEIELSLKRLDQLKVKIKKNKQMERINSELSQNEQKKPQIFLEDDIGKDRVSDIFLADLKKNQKQRIHKLRVSQKDSSFNQKDQTDQNDECFENTSVKEEEDDERLNIFKLNQLGRKFNTQVSNDSQYIKNKLSPSKIIDEQTLTQNTQQPTAFDQNQTITDNQVHSTHTKNHLPYFYKRIPKNRVPMKMNIICDKFQAVNQFTQHGASGSNLQQTPPYSPQKVNEETNSYRSHSNQQNAKLNETNQKIENLYAQIITSVLKNNITHKIDNHQYYDSKNTIDEFNQTQCQTNELKLPKIENRQVRAFNQTSTYISMKKNKPSNIYQVPIIDNSTQEQSDPQNIQKKILNYKRDSQFQREVRSDSKQKYQRKESPSPNEFKNLSNLNQTDMNIKNGSKISYLLSQQNFNSDQKVHQNKINNNSQLEAYKKQISPNSVNDGVSKRKISIDNEVVFSNIYSEQKKSQNQESNKTNLLNSNTNLFKEIQTNPSLILIQNPGDMEMNIDKNLSYIQKNKAFSTTSNNRATKYLIESPNKVITKGEDQERSPSLFDKSNVIRIKQITKNEEQLNYTNPIQTKESNSIFRMQERIRHISENNGKKRVSPSANEHRLSISNNISAQKYKRNSCESTDNYSSPQTKYLQLFNEFNVNKNINFDNGSSKTYKPFQSQKPAKTVQLQYLQRQKINPN